MGQDQSCFSLVSPWAVPSLRFPSSCLPLLQPGVGQQMTPASQNLVHQTCTHRSHSGVCCLSFSSFLQIKQGWWVEPGTAGLPAVTSAPPCPLPSLWPAEGLMNLWVFYALGPSSPFPASGVVARGCLQPRTELSGSRWGGSWWGQGWMQPRM